MDKIRLETEILPVSPSTKKGRPLGKRKATIQVEQARAYAVKIILSNLDEILQGMTESAKGLWTEQKDKEGNTIKVYQKAPELKASEYLLNQGIGKAKETMEVTEVKRIMIDF